MAPLSRRFQKQLRYRCALLNRSSSPTSSLADQGCGGMQLRMTPTNDTGTTDE